METIIEKKLCTGCMACFNACWQNCIQMQEDEEGFLFPAIDKEKCIQCNLCVKSCPIIVQPKVESYFEKPIIYAAWSLNEETRYQSTSGGIFSEIAATFVTRPNRYVVGAKYTDNHMVEHYIIDKIGEIPILRQSKYTQSNIGLVFRRIRDLLDKDKDVLFCGTPCEVAGLLSFLNKRYSRLYICDFICRGANSPKVYRMYLDMMEQKYKSKIKRVWFKNKTYGWNRFSTKIIFENGKEYIQDRYSDLYMKGYIEHNLYMRICCSECKYKVLPRLSDITLADFWGIGQYKIELDHDKGTSLLLINTEKGKNMLLEIKERIYSEERTLEEAIKGNQCIFNSAKTNSNRDIFFKELASEDFEALMKKYCQDKMSLRLKRVINRIIIKLIYKLKIILKRGRVFQCLKIKHY